LSEKGANYNIAIFLIDPTAEKDGWPVPPQEVERINGYGYVYASDEKNG
jgi:hypothetical protein